MIARTPRSADSTSSRTRGISRRILLGSMLAAPFVARQAYAAETLNAYSIWPENYARPMMEAFEKSSGIRVKFIRFSSGEALARVTAEKNNPQIDVLFGGPVETFTAGQTQGIFEPYIPPGAAELPPRFKDKGGAWTARSPMIRWCS
jgi:iron(III) transport system substrate-binding protein